MSTAAFENSNIEEYKLENDVLGQIITDLQTKLQLAERRTRDAETKLASFKTPPVKAGEQVKELEQKVEKLKRKSINDRVLLEQALRSKEKVAETLEEERQQRIAQAAETDELRNANILLQENNEQRVAQTQRLKEQLERANPHQAACLAKVSCRQEGESKKLDIEREKVVDLQRHCEYLASELRKRDKELLLVKASVQAARLSKSEKHIDFAAEAQSGDQQQGHTCNNSLHRQQPGLSANLADAQELAHLDDLEGISLFHCNSPARSSQGSPPAARGADIDLEWQQDAAQYKYGSSPGSSHQCQAPGSPAGSGNQDNRRQQAHGDSCIAPRPGLVYCEHCLQEVPEEPLGTQQGTRQQHVYAQLWKLQYRNAELQKTLANTHLQRSKAADSLQQELKVVRQKMHELQQCFAAAQRRCSVLQSSSSAATSNGEALQRTVEQLQEEVLEYARRMTAALEQNAALMQEKGQWVERVQTVEQELQQSRQQLVTLKMYQARLLHEEERPCQDGQACSPTSQALLLISNQTSMEGTKEGDLGEQLLQHLVTSQAAESALWEVLEEVRKEQVATCRAVSNELRRVHTLEKLRVADMREVQRLQRKVGELQKEISSLYEALAVAQPASSPHSNCCERSLGVSGNL